MLFLCCYVGLEVSKMDKRELKKGILILLGILLLVALLRVVHNLNSQTLTEYVAEEQQ